MTDFLRKIRSEKNARPVDPKVKARPLMQDIKPPERKSGWIRQLSTKQKTAANQKDETQERVGEVLERQQPTAANKGKTLSPAPNRPEKPESNPRVAYWRPRHLFHLPSGLHGLSRRRSFIATGAGVVIIAYVVATLAFAHTTIMLRPVSAELDIPETHITADIKATLPESDRKRIPGMKIVVEKTITETFSASGKKYVEDRAIGSLIIFNRYSSSPQPLQVKTRFIDTGGRVFRLTRPVIVPGAKIEEGKIIQSSIRAEVVADQPGGEYNIPVADFTIPGFKGTPKYDGFYGKSDAPMRGGFKGEARVVTASDITAAEEKASRDLFDQLKSELQEKIPQSNDFVFLDGSRIIAVTGITAPRPNERRGEFSVEAKGNAAVIIFKASDLIKTLETLFLVPERPSTILPTLAALNFKNIKASAQSGVLQFDIAGKVTAIRTIPSDEIRLLARKKRTSALETLLRMRPEVAGFTIHHSPFWRWKTPSNDERIDVRLELPETTGSE